MQTFHHKCQFCTFFVRNGMNDVKMKNAKFMAWKMLAG